MAQVSVSTIGFTKSDAERFFGRLLTAGVRKLLDDACIILRS